MLNGIGGQLATIRSAAAQEAIAQMASDAGQDLFLGGSDRTFDGSWFWQDSSGDAERFWNGDTKGHNVDGSYTNWLSGEPNNVGSQSNLQIFSATGLWDDLGDGETRGSIIEWDVDSVLDATQALTYTIQSQTVAGAFEIDADSGEIRVLDGSLLDFESNATHSITIRTTDVDSNTYDEVFTISLNDLAEANNSPTDLSSGIELNADGGNDAYFEASDGDAIVGGLSKSPSKCS